MSASTADITVSEDAVNGAFGVGMQFFNATQKQRKNIIANAVTLEKDEWETLSDRMVEVYRSNLTGIQDLRSAGLTRSLSLATQVDLWQTVSDFTDAEVTMDGEVDSTEDRVTYATQGVPIPIVHKNFRVSQRELMTSRNMNNDLRTDGVSNATRQVAEMLDDILFSGWSPQVVDSDGNEFTLFGYTDHPDRNQVSGSSWEQAANIRSDIVEMLNKLDQDNRTGGGFWLYLSPTEWRQFRSAKTPEADDNQTVRQTIMNQFDTEIAAIKRAERLPEGEAVMVDPSPDVVELAVAEDVQTIEWQSGSGMTNFYKVMAAMAPEIKSDAKGRSGVVHLTGI